MNTKPLEKTGQTFRSVTQSFPPVAACWVILLVIMSLRIYFTSVMSENNAKLTAEMLQLKTFMQHLNNQTTHTNNLESKITNLTAENQQLKVQNQELETQRNNLTETIQDTKTEWNEQNVSRAQWSIDAYCPKRAENIGKVMNEVRNCNSCQDGWTSFQSSCYAINDAKPVNRMTWDEAQANCKGKISDLVVIANEDEKTFINKKSCNSAGVNRYWIGLKAEEGKWKWVNGSDLTEESWIQEPAPDGHCVISAQRDGLKSVNCDKKNQWICKKNCLSV